MTKIVVKNIFQILPRPGGDAKKGASLKSTPKKPAASAKLLARPALTKAARHLRDLKREAGYRAAFKARGLRSDGKPFVPQKPCGCRNGCCLLCQKPGDKRYFPPAKLAALRADYDSGMAAAAVERKHGLSGKSLQAFFRRRGWPWRKYTRCHLRRINGRFQKDPPKSAREIAALIAQLKFVRVPAALKAEWKHWSLARRGKFIAQVRAHLAGRGHTFAPTGPHSANVQPFDYTTPAARAIMAAANAGRNSRTKAIQLHPGSQGMIHAGELWFWAHDGHQRQLHGHREERGQWRPFLHRHIYEKFYGKIPAGMTVIHVDGNKNNFDKQNLALRSMADCARMNHLSAQCLRNPTPENFARKAEMFQRIAGKAWATRNARRTQMQRRALATLLQSDGNVRGLLANLVQEAVR